MAQESPPIPKPTTAKRAQPLASPVSPNVSSRKDTTPPKATEGVAAEGPKGKALSKSSEELDRPEGPTLNTVSVILQSKDALKKVRLLQYF